MRVKIVTSPWVAEVFEICGLFLFFAQHLQLLGQTDEEQAQHTGHLTFGWIMG